MTTPPMPQLATGELADVLREAHAAQIAVASQFGDRPPWRRPGEDRLCWLGRVKKQLSHRPITFGEALEAAVRYEFCLDLLATAHDAKTIVFGAEGAYLETHDGSILHAPASTLRRNAA